MLLFTRSFTLSFTRSFTLLFTLLFSISGVYSQYNCYNCYDTLNHLCNSNITKGYSKECCKIAIENNDCLKCHTVRKICQPLITIEVILYVIIGVITFICVLIAIIIVSVLGFIALKKLFMKLQNYMPLQEQHHMYSV